MDWSLWLALLGIPAGYMAGRWIRPYQHTSKEYNRTSFYALPALFEREVDEGLDNLTDDEITRMPETLSDAAHALAGDYRGLARELCERLTAAETVKAGA